MRVEPYQWTVVVDDEMAVDYDVQRGVNTEVKEREGERERAAQVSTVSVCARVGRR